MPNSNNGHKTIQAGDYQVTFHPAFASRCCVQAGEGTEEEIYKQVEVFNLRGAQHPKRHEIHFAAHGRKRDVRLAIDDPHHHIARITIELYDPEIVEPSSRVGLDARAMASTETVTFENNAQTCPPYCKGETTTP